MLKNLLPWHWHSKGRKKPKEACAEGTNGNDSAKTALAINEIKQEYIRENEHRNRGECWKSFREYLTIVLLCVTVIITWITYGVFRRQLNATLLATNTAHVDSERALNAANDSANAALIIAKESATTGAATMEGEERAWLMLGFPTDPRAQLAGSGEIVTSIDLLNVGNTPATNVRLFGKGSFFEPIMETVGGNLTVDMATQNIIPNTTCDVIDMGATRSVIWPHSAPIEAKGGKPVAIDPGFFTLKKYFIYQACVKYDSLGKTHYTRACYVFEGLTTIRPENTTEWGLCSGKGEQDAD